MTPKERVMTAPRRGRLDQLPWVDGPVDATLQRQTMGGRPFTGKGCKS